MIFLVSKVGKDFVHCPLCLLNLEILWARKTGDFYCRFAKKETESQREVTCPKLQIIKMKKKWPGIPIVVPSVPSTLHLLALLLWRRGHPELSLRGEGTGEKGAGQSRLDKLRHGCPLAQMGIHKGQGEGIGAWKCTYEERERERLPILYSSCWAGPDLVALGYSYQVWAPTEKGGFHTLSTWGPRAGTLLRSNSRLLPAAATGWVIKTS